MYKHVNHIWNSKFIKSTFVLESAVSKIYLDKQLDRYQQRFSSDAPLKRFCDYMWIRNHFYIRKRFEDATAIRRTRSRRKKKEQRGPDGEGSTYGEVTGAQEAAESAKKKCPSLWLSGSPCTINRICLSKSVEVFLYSISLFSPNAVNVAVPNKPLYPETNSLFVLCCVTIFDKVPVTLQDSPGIILLGTFVHTAFKEYRQCSHAQHLNAISTPILPMACTVSVTWYTRC